jgi:hypothetical protein
MTAQRDDVEHLSRCTQPIPLEPVDAQKQKVEARALAEMNADLAELAGQGWQVKRQNRMTNLDAGTYTIQHFLERRLGSIG